MNENWCDWHVLHVHGEEDEREIDVLHPSDCNVRIETSPNGTIFQYVCWIAWEMTEGGGIGYKSLAEYEPGWYRVRGRTFTIPSGPWGAQEADVETEESVIRWDRIETESEIEVGRDA